MPFWFGTKKKVGDITEGGKAQVEGIVFGAEHLQPKGSRTKCIYYDLFIEVFKRGARGGGRAFWQLESADRKSQGFFIDDGTGKIWVVDDSDAYIVKGARIERGQMGKSAKRRYTVNMIKAGDTVQVRGIVDSAQGAEPEGLVIRPTAKGRLIITIKKKAQA